MRKLLLLPPCLILCCGFAAAPFQADAVPRAQAAREQALQACRARTDFKSTADAIDCVVAADRDFAQAIRLRDAKLLADYSGKIKALDADIGSGALKPDDVAVRFRDLQNGFFKTVNDQYIAYQADMAEDNIRDVTAAAERAATQDMHANSMNPMNGMSGMGN